MDLSGFADPSTVETVEVHYWTFGTAEEKKALDVDYSTAMAQGEWALKNGTYWLYVKILDQNGNELWKTSTIQADVFPGETTTVLPVDGHLELDVSFKVVPEPPIIESIYSRVPYSDKTADVTIYWTPSSDSENVAYYQAYYRSAGSNGKWSVFDDNIYKHSTSISKSMSKGTQYEFVMVAVGHGGFPSPLSNIMEHTTEKY